MKKTISLILAILCFCGSVQAYNTGSTITISAQDEVLNKAHQFAYDNQITTVASLNWFRPELNVTRAQAAKMMVMFGRAYLGDNYFYRPDKTIDCSFSDRGEISKDLRSFVIESCRFGIFAGGSQRFEPLGKLTVGQAKIVIKRISGKDSIMTETGSDSQYISRGELIKLMYKEYERLLEIK